MAAITRPENWEIIVNFAEAPRGTYKEIREARPDVATARKALADWLEKKIADTSVRIEDNWRNCEFTHKGWIKEKQSSANE